MSEIHFVHTSDWHLGFKQYNLDQRTEDFYQAALKVVERIIELKPQFVLHTGDLFHKQIPEPHSMIQAAKLFDMLLEANIPVYMVRGNHDARVSKHLRSKGNSITLLDILGKVRNVEDEVIQIGNDISLYGIGYYTGSGATRKLEALMLDHPVDEMIFNVVAMHAFVEGQMTPQTQIKLIDLADFNVNYIGVGHYHKAWMHEENKIYAPGCTETPSSSDWKKLEKYPEVSLYTSFFEVKAKKEKKRWSTPNVETHYISVRPKLDLTFHSETTMLHQLEEELRTFIDSRLVKYKELFPEFEKPVLKLSLASVLSDQDLKSLNIEAILGDCDLLSIQEAVHGRIKETVEGWSTKPDEIEVLIRELIDEEEEHPNELSSIIIDLIEKYGHHPLKDPDDNSVRKLIDALNLDTNKLEDLEITHKQGVN